jgi:hypothetical protein
MNTPALVKNSWNIAITQQLTSQLAANYIMQSYISHAVPDPVLDHSWFTSQFLLNHENLFLRLLGIVPVTQFTIPSTYFVLDQCKDVLSARIPQIKSFSNRPCENIMQHL